MIEKARTVGLNRSFGFVIILLFFVPARFTGLVLLCTISSTSAPGDGMFYECPMLTLKKGPSCCSLCAIQSLYVASEMTFSDVRFTSAAIRASCLRKALYMIFPSQSLTTQ